MHTYMHSKGTCEHTQARTHTQMLSVSMLTFLQLRWYCISTNDYSRDDYTVTHYTHACLSTNVHLCVCTYICKHVHIHLHIHICIHADTHTHNNSR